MPDEKNHSVNDQMAHLLYEAMQSVGRNADGNALADKIRKLELGLPLEDEFMMVLSWLGKCCLVHKLDQLQVPRASKSNFRVPDLLAVFEYQDRLIPVLIEVKGKQPFAFSWRPDYVDGLRHYGQLLGLPVLLACKWKVFGIWTLIDIEEFEKPNQNLRYTFKNALRQNLMGLLAGDFVFIFKKGIGLHIKARKLERLNQKQDGDLISEQWQVRVEEGYYTNGVGAKVKFKDEANLWPLLLSAEAVAKTSMTETHLIHSLIIPDEHLSQTAHRSLVVHCSHFVDEQHPLNWRELLLESRPFMECAELRKAAIDGIERNNVQYVLDQVPESKPAFLKDRTSDRCDVESK